MKQKRLFRRNIYSKGITSYSKDLISGDFGYIVLANHVLNKKNLESGRVLIRRELKKKSFLFVRPKFTIPVTKKPNGIRMGKGKGPINEYISFLKVDTCLYEMKKVQLANALKILKKLSYKFGVPLALVHKNGTRYYVKK
jgi:large subunit ribosomal protein L16